MVTNKADRPKRGGGRPARPEGNGTVFLRAPLPLLEKIDEHAAKMSDQPSRPEMIRRILEAFIDQGWELGEAA